jgi:ABC-type transport system substrate-binding protein
VPPIWDQPHVLQESRSRSLIDLATTAKTDEERRKYYSDVQKLVAEEVPYVSLWYKTNVA